VIEKSHIKNFCDIATSGSCASNSMAEADISWAATSLSYRSFPGTECQAEGRRGSIPHGKIPAMVESSLQ
jgi:hypothetical protein